MMNTTNNKKRRESQEKIEKIFVNLLQEKAINEISITDICKKAHLNRTTFYNNYLDIYDLAEKIKEKLEQDVFNLYQEERLNRYNSNDFSKILTMIKNNPLFFKTYFKLGFDSTHEALGDVYQYDINQAKDKYDGKYIDYHIEFFKAGFNAIVKKWLNNNCQESVEEICEIIKSEYKKS